MKCWICGDEGTTGEHFPKASDLSALYKNVSQKRPLFLHTKDKINQRIGSVKKSDKLKSKSLICKNCNNARTAPHDDAWKKLSEYLRKRHTTLIKLKHIRLDKVFPGSVTRSMLGVHLYFVKLFGCTIVEHGINIDIASFSEAILQQKSHPKLYLSFGFSSEMQIGRSDMETRNLYGKCAYATWLYLVGPVFVMLIYAEPSEHRQGLVNAWHPTTISKRIHFDSF